MRNIIKLLLLFFIYCVGFSQSTKGQALTYCHVLEAILKDDHAGRIFKYGFFPDHPIIFIDLTHKFQNCILSKPGERNITISEDSSLMKNKNITYIIIHKVDVRGRHIQIFLEQKGTAAFGDIQLKRRAKEVKILKISMGYLDY